jgi:putative flippase GtrA
MTAMARRFLLFAGVGALGTAVHYLVLAVLVEVADVDPRLATAFGFAAGAIVNYALNYRFTFVSSRSHLETAPRFFAIAVIGGVLNVFLVHLGTQVLAMHYFVSQILSTGIVLVFNFAANSAWTFAVTTGIKR